MGALARALVPSQVGERRALTVFYRPVGPGRRRPHAPAAPRCRRRWRPRCAARSAGSNAPRSDEPTEQLHETDEKLERGRVAGTASPPRSSITVPAAWNAQDYGRRLDASVRLCGFTPLPLDGAHDAAFAAAAIPLGDRPARAAGVGADPWPGARTASRSVPGPPADRLRHPASAAGAGAARAAAPTSSSPRSVAPRGRRQTGHGWAPTLPPLAGYQMTSEQTPVMWPLIAGDGLPPTGAPMGFDVLSGGILLLRPDGLGERRLHPGHQPQRLHLRQARSRQVSPGQGVHAPDDPLRLPVPGPRRRQGRVRGHLPGPRRRAVPHRTRPAGSDQPARPRPARRSTGSSRTAPRQPAAARSSSTAGSP